MTTEPGTPPLTRRHVQRLRELYRSSGWPCHDMLEAELLAGGWLERLIDAQQRETLRLTDAGIAALARAHASAKAALDGHERLVEHVARCMSQAGHVVWTRLSLRVPLETDEGEGAGTRWTVACPDVFSVRHTTVPAYLEPTVHEIKVRRADLLGDLKKPAKRAAYLAMGGACWYVLGPDAKGRPIARPDEIPPECGVMTWDGDRLEVLRAAPRRERADLPFATWMELARATPWRDDGAAQGLL